MVGIVQFTVPQTGPQNVPVDSESPTVKPLQLLTFVVIDGALVET